MQHSAAQAYQQVGRQTASPRVLEANLLSKSAGNLQRIRDDWDNSKGELYQALLYNRKLWSIFVQSVTGEASQLPTKLREKGMEELVEDAERRARQEAKTIIENHKREQLHHEELIKKDVDKQNERINDRVSRRKSGLNRSAFGSFVGEPAKPSFASSTKFK